MKNPLAADKQELMDKTLKPWCRVEPLHLLFPAVLLLLFYLSSLAGAAETIALSTGQTVYIPAYSNIYHGNNETPLLLSVTLSIRNVDPNDPLTITSVNYYETQGALVKQYLKQPMVLGPLGADRFIVPQKDDTGGSGANFIVEWQAKTAINPPIMETVMIGSQSQLGISFTSRGQVIEK